MKRGNQPFCCLTQTLRDKNQIHFLFFRVGEVLILHEDGNGDFNRLGTLLPAKHLETLDECLDYLNAIGYRKTVVVHNSFGRYQKVMGW